jgi:hypothetical protein
MSEDADVKELSELADQMFQSIEKKSVSATATTAKPKKKPAEGAAAKPKKSSAEKHFELFPTVDDAVKAQNGRKVSSLDQVISLSAAATADSDAVRMEIVALKPVGKLFLLRQLRDPAKPTLSSLKKLGHAEVKVNKDRKEGAFFILKRIAASQQPKKKIEKQKKPAEAKKKAAPKKEKKKTAVSEGGDPRKRLSEGIEKLKKKTAARSASGQKMAVTASEVVAQGSA